MKHPYRLLPLHRLDRGIRHARPKQRLPRRITTDDPALSVMTDLCQVTAVTTELSTPLGKGLDIMIKRGVRILLVVDADDNLLGLVTSRDVDGEKVTRILAKTHCARDDLLVADVMTLRAKLEAGSVDDGRRTERASGRHHRNLAAGQPPARSGIGHRSRNRDTGGARHFLAVGDRFAAGIGHQSIAAADYLYRIGEGWGRVVTAALTGGADPARKFFRHQPVLHPV